MESFLLNYVFLNGVFEVKIAHKAPFQSDIIVTKQLIFGQNGQK